MVDEIIEKLKKFFEGREEVQFAILFGSLAKGTANAFSDIDIAVMIDPQFDTTFPYGYQATLIADLMQVLRRNDIDVVMLNNAPIILRYQILRCGNFICVRDEQVRTQFQIDTINRYEDFKRMYAVHESACRRRWENLMPSKAIPNIEAEDGGET